jgi:hypothetical protein
MTLSQEAASLHLVLEMRNQEVRSLREKTASLEHRLERFENVQVSKKRGLSIRIRSDREFLARSGFFPPLDPDPYNHAYI